MKDPYKRFTREILATYDLRKYSNCLEDLVNKIRNSDCKIYTREDMYASSSSTNIESGEQIIRISVKDKSKHGLEIIWDILHEFGHIKSDPRKKDDTNYQREIIAWNLAELELANYPEL